MPIQPVQFDQILYVKKLTTRGGKYTEFGFAAESIVHKGVLVYGWHDIAVGQSVVAALRKKDDWSTLVGWFDSGTGKFVQPNPGPILMGAFMAGFGSCSLFFGISKANAISARGNWYLGAIGLGFFLWAAFLVRQLFQSKNAWNELLASLPGHQDK